MTNLKQPEFDIVKDIPKDPNIGRVHFELEYFVDLNDKSMVEHAKTCIYEDIMSLVKYNEVFNHIGVQESSEHNYEDIPEFLKESIDDEN